jgi:hypothetical protein
MAKSIKTLCSLAQAAEEVGVDALVLGLVAGEWRAIGREYGEGLPRSIPPEHFAVPLREYQSIRQEDLDALIELGHLQVGAKLPVGFTWAGVPWVDPDFDERTGHCESPYPATCLDIGGSAIYADGEPRWTDVQIEKSKEVGAPPKAKPGPKPKWDPEAIKAFVFERMDYHGDFSPDDPAWRAIADLEREIQERFSGHDGAGPGHGTLQPLLGPMIEGWRACRNCR